ncbi:Zn-dependent hydrolase [Bacillus sp. DTU_2020_1000418_1_SI_GHA_SEK_038]|uniref:Zn-dependent hydrolase n=1 Tax=Bacillus sp. DTU_2020_1000418_1_SI_GHA_SEK_038 TaxID=3077585 RepID=UPI0028F14818|nr:Zn-dependent hydrolase [Bacillus sp. DTU_2020_1000418_1_SI_GHA_SEK_038]WNS76562.1 Zn-dependent hydrolase [Bacillus sp. DTU_2020_1000418_1_SI_GHA_SEK_038]
MNIARVLQTLDAFNEFGKTENGISRIAFTDEEQKAKEYFIKQCESLGMFVTVDPVGNIIARREGKNDLLPAVAIGSHLDTVYNGGKFDGVVGVVAGLEVVRTLVEERIATLHPIEIICFSCEESSRFNFSTLGSKAMIGDLTLESLRTLKDRDDIPIEAAFKDQKLILENYKRAERNTTELKVFYEVHIEQGSRLIESEKSIGLVTGIAAPLRLAINIKGKSSHSGTTGMKQRKDALLAASELTMIVEMAALAEIEFETVATVGVLDIYPSAMNVIPGIAKLKIDIRSTDIKSRYRVLNRIKDGILFIQKKRGVSVSIDWMHEEEPVLMDKNITEEIASICENLGLNYMFMPSGAGHDAMNMAKRWPASLIFIPSVDGLSHHPEEYTEQTDIEAGIKLLEKVVKSSAIISTGEESQHGIASSQNYLECEGK